MEGSDLCGIHQRKADGVKTEKKPKEPKEPKEPKKAKKVAPPNHNHSLEEESEDCELCNTHGNILDPAATDAKFEAISMQERLKAILETADDESAEPEKTEAEPEKTEVEPEKVVAEPVKKSFIRPKMKAPKNVTKPADVASTSAPIKPVADVASTSAPIKPDDEEMNIRDKLRMILANANGDESEDEEDMESRLTNKLAKTFDEDEDDIDLDQMCDSPTSQNRLREAWADMSEEEESETEEN
jgi:hypothetical protein